MRYIEDVVQGYLKEHKEQENIHDIVERALEQRKKLNLEEKDGILLEVDTMEFCRECKEVPKFIVVAFLLCSRRSWPFRNILDVRISINYLDEKF